MKLSRDKPTKMGWYWVEHTRPRSHSTTKPMFIVRTNDGLAIQEVAGYTLVDNCGDNWRFAGPLEMPEIADE